MTKGIGQNYTDVKSCLDLSSDHSPIIATISSTIIYKEHSPTLSNKLTNWEKFRQIMNENISLKIPLKTPDDIDDAVEFLNSTIQTCCWQSTPGDQQKNLNHINYPVEIKRRIAEKRRLRRIWQQSRNQRDKANLKKLLKI